MDLPTLPSKSPYVIERREHHPSGATYVTFLAPGGSTTEPRWVSFGEAKKFLAARDIERCWPYIAPDLRAGIEPWTLTVRAWDDVYRERKSLYGKEAMSRLAPDFPEGQAVADRLARSEDEAIRRELWKREKLQEGHAQDFRNADCEDPRNRSRVEVIGWLQMEKKAIRREARERGTLLTAPDEWQVLRPSSTLTVGRVLDRSIERGLN